MSRLNTDPFQAIADDNRRRILLLLADKRLPVNSLAEHFDISRPAVSKHIKVLEEAGFVRIEVQGRERYCQLSPSGFDAVKDWLTYFDQFWKEKLQNLENLLEQRAQTTNH
jgi:DNA-binding transcriptional ArsR family regulator